MYLFSLNKKNRSKCNSVILYACDNNDQLRYDLLLISVRDILLSFVLKCRIEAATYRDANRG